MINVDFLVIEAKANEPKTIYDMHNASCGCKDETWDTLTFNHGGSAKAVIKDNTLTLYYADGTVSTYTGA